MLQNWSLTQYDEFPSIAVLLGVLADNIIEWSQNHQLISKNAGKAQGTTIYCHQIGGADGTW